MYYLADFAFENISNRARERIRERANQFDQGKYKRSLNFETKVSKGRLSKGKITLNSPEPLQLREKLKSLYQNPNNPINNQVIPTRVIGTKNNPLKSNLFPNTKTVLKNTAIKTEKIGTSANPLVKNSMTLGNKLALGFGIPAAIAGTIITVNKLKGKTWNGKEK